MKTAFERVSSISEALLICLNIRSKPCYSVPYSSYLFCFPLAKFWGGVPFLSNYSINHPTPCDGNRRAFSSNRSLLTGTSGSLTLISYTNPSYPKFLSKETNQWGEGVMLIHKLLVLTVVVGVASLGKDELGQL